MTADTIMRVGDILEQNYSLVDGLITVEQALIEIRDKGVKVLIIDKRHPDDEYGMVLLSDISRQVLANNRAPSRVNIYEIMEKPLITVDPDMDIRYCARLFDRYSLNNVPVIQNGELLGIIGYADLVLKGLCRNIG